MEEGKIINGHDDVAPDAERSEMLQRLRSTASVQMSPELFEKLYLNPQSNVKGDLRRTFGNPTPIALVGHLMSLTPLSCALMGWGGADGAGAGTVGTFFFMGGLLMVIGGLFEWVLGNSFAAVVFCSFGGFWFSYGASLTQAFNTNTTPSPQSAGFWYVFMGILCVIYLVCALRTNVVFVVIFLSLVIVFILLSIAQLSAGSVDSNAAIATMVHRCTVGAGASAFVTCIAAWYLLTSIMLAIVDFPLSLPVGDLSSVIKGKSEHHRR